MKIILYLLIAAFCYSSISLCGEEEVPKTVLSPILDTELEGSTNVIYCPTFQLAWNELKKLADGDIKMEDPSATLEKLNRSQVTAKIVPKNAYIALAGLVKDGILEKIDKELMKKFRKNVTDMSFCPTPDATLMAFSYLFRKLEFVQKFHRFKKAFIFNHGKSHKTNVVAFGCTPKTAEYYQDYIRIRHYADKDNFVLQLLTKTKGETVVLTKMPTPKTLRSAVDFTAKHILKKWKPYTTIEKDGEKEIIINEFSSIDLFLMPIVDFDKNTNFNNLCGKQVKNPIFNGNGLNQAFQRVKFKLDEVGARVESEAYMGDCFGGSPTPPKPRKFVLNNSFLLCLWKKDAKLPYLAVWVNNPDILLRTSTK